MRKRSWSKRAEDVSEEIISAVDAKLGRGEIYRMGIGGDRMSRQLLVGETATWRDDTPESEKERGQKHRTVTKVLTKLYGKPTVAYPGKPFAHYQFATSHGIDITFGVNAPPNDYIHFSDRET